MCRWPPVATPLTQHNTPCDEGECVCVCVSLAALASVLLSPLLRMCLSAWAGGCGRAGVHGREERVHRQRNQGGKGGRRHQAFALGGGRGGVEDGARAGRAAAARDGAARRQGLAGTPRANTQVSD
eukprot:1180471-Prorocentrum_minimum.AAC.2